MQRIYSLLALGLLFLGGCASSPMTVAPEQTLPTVKADEAQVVFMRTSSFGGAISAALFDVTDDQTRYIGISTVGTRIAVKTTPGKHRYMVVSEAADFMEAELVGGKTYYAMVTPRMGAWRARFSLWPIRKGPGGEFSHEDEKIAKWRDSTKLLVQSQASLDWYAENKASVESKKQEYLPVWRTKTPADRAERTLKPEDGL